MDDKGTPTQRNSGPPATNGFDLNRPTVINLCYLGGFVTGGVSSIVGIILAHVWAGEDRNGWLGSHYTYLIRTFWVGLGASILAFLLSFVFIGLLMFPLIAVWVIVRSVMSLLKAQKKEPMPEPETLLF